VITVNNCQEHYCQDCKKVATCADCAKSYCELSCICFLRCDRCETLLCASCYTSFNYHNVGGGTLCLCNRCKPRQYDACSQSVLSLRLTNARHVMARSARIAEILRSAATALSPLATRSAGSSTSVKSAMLTFVMGVKSPFGALGADTRAARGASVSTTVFVPYAPTTPKGPRCSNERQLVARCNSKRHICIALYIIGQQLDGS
jgi:hypothetical protein